MWKMVSKLMCSRQALLLFTVGFSIYLFIKSYLISSVGSDGEKENLLLLSGNGAVHTTLVPMYGTISAVNLSVFETMFGNESCRADVLGAPPYIRTAGCNNGECDTITCKRLLVGDEEAVTAAVKFTDAHLRKTKSESEVLRSTMNCEEFRKLGGYRDTPVRPSDADFPIAFNVLVHWHLEQFERLLRAIYRPQNVYCIHVDAKTSWTFHSTIAAMSQCLDNVYVATRRQLVVYAGFSRLQADIDCMHDHLTSKVKWRYLINIAGQSFPLRTPEEIVDILRIYNGANDVEGIYKRRIFNRFQKVWKERVDLGKVENMNITHVPPPHDIDIVRGSAYGIFSREFVEFIINDQRAKDLLEWSRDTYSPDEHYWATLHHTYSNPHLDTPGGYSGFPDSKPFLAVYAKWYPQVECHGVWKRGVCVFGVGDLPDLVLRPEFFVNKFAIDYHPLALECLEAWLEHRVRCSVPFNTSYYHNLPFILP